LFAGWSRILALARLGAGEGPPAALLPTSGTAHRGLYASPRRLSVWRRERGLSLRSCSGPPLRLAAQPRCCCQAIAAARERPRGVRTRVSNCMERGSDRRATAFTPSTLSSSRTQCRDSDDRSPHREQWRTGSGRGSPMKQFRQSECREAKRDCEPQGAKEEDDLHRRDDAGLGGVDGRGVISEIAR